MAQYISDHLDKLEIVEKFSAKVTVHDACKVALTGLDVAGAREILKAIGAQIVEMPRSGPGAACCGCTAIGNYPVVGNQMLEERIDEAAEPGATVLSTVCHYCNQMLASHQQNTPFSVESYINLLAASLGIKREDKFKKYMRWVDADRILADAAPFADASPFPHALIKRNKSINDIELNLGRVNALIGENGGGKTKLLESICLASAAAENKMDNEFLASRGIRVSEAVLMRSAFETISANKPIEISLHGEGADFECILKNGFSLTNRKAWRNEIFKNSKNYLR